jgi:hypothetical protein
MREHVDCVKVAARVAREKIFSQRYKRHVQKKFAAEKRARSNDSRE